MAYTKPELRERIKNKVMASTKGGKAGQWSARKAQIVAQEYKKAGGGYTGSKTSKQKSLSKWTKEDWGLSQVSLAHKARVLQVSVIFPRKHVKLYHLLNMLRLQPRSVKTYAKENNFLNNQSQ